MYSGLIISGGENNAGTTAEVFVPSTGQHCRLPDMPGFRRYFHTMEKMVVCGGIKDEKTCLTLTDGIWKETQLLEYRYYFYAEEFFKLYLCLNLIHALFGKFDIDNNSICKVSSH